MKILFKNANLVDKNGARKSNLVVKDNLIDQITEENLDDQQFDSVIDCNNLTIMPGFIDLHSHLRDPGLTYKEDIESGLKAAAKGGFTTVCAMANTKPVTDTYEKVLKNHAKAESVDLTELIQVSAVTEDFGDKIVDIESISQITPLFSNDGQNINDKDLMREILLESQKYPSITIATHNQPETKTIVRDIELLKEVGGKLHFCHISKKETLEAIREALEAGLNVSCEVTPHHLYASELDYKVHPPFRKEEDRLALIEGIKDGTIKYCGTDHAPHSEEDKANGSPGINNYETAFGMYHKVFNENDIPLSKLSEMFSYNPAKLLNLDSGLLEPGYPADFVIVDPDAEWKIDRDNLISKSKNTPFDGEVLLGKVLKTIHNGKEIYNSEEIEF